MKTKKKETNKQCKQGIRVILSPEQKSQWFANTHTNTKGKLHN